MKKIVVGIDLGTTFSSVAYVNENGRPEVIANADGNKMTPSVVLIKDDQIIVGQAALNRWIIDQEHVVRWIKRSMGDDDYRFQGKSPVEISAEILKVLKTDAEANLGRPLEEAVITCPAYFNAIEIENTKAAGELAGFAVREIVKEPTAASVYYGVDNMEDGQTAMVCDLGGGTFDATILKLEDGAFIPVASMGSRELGGHDWSMELVRMVAERFRGQFGEDPRDDVVSAQKLYEDCEAAKCDFARQSEVSIACHCRGRIENIVLSRDDFEAETEWLIQQMVMWANRSLEKVKMTWDDIDLILLVGGASRLRRMSLALEESSGKKPTQTAEPDLMVALGAAILACGKVRPRKLAGLVDAPKGGLIDIIYKRILVRSFGTRAVVLEGDKPRIANSVIIPQGTQVPESGLTCSRDDYEVLYDGQECFDLPIVEFENDEEFEEHRNYRFKCLRNAKRGDPIRVTFHYDKSGIITAEATDLNSKKALVGERLPYEEPDIEAIVSIRVKPRWVVFAIDVSGSMEGEKIENAKKALIENAKELLAAGGGECKVGIVSFASSAETVCRPTDDLRELRRAVDDMTAYGTTAMDDGIRRAVSLVMDAPAGTDRDIVMLTDGMPDPERRGRTLDAARKASSSGVSLLIGELRSDDVDQSFLKELSPLVLEIERADGIAQAMANLLKQSAIRRGGLTDAGSGGSARRRK